MATITLNLPDDQNLFQMPQVLKQRLQLLLDQQDSGESLTDSERAEAAGLVDVAELLTLLRLRAERR